MFLTADLITMICTFIAIIWISILYKTLRPKNLITITKQMVFRGSLFIYSRNQSLPSLKWNSLQPAYLYTVDASALNKLNFSCKNSAFDGSATAWLNRTHFSNWSFTCAGPVSEGKQSLLLSVTPILSVFIKSLKICLTDVTDLGC